MLVIFNILVCVTVPCLQTVVVCVIIFAMVIVVVTCRIFICVVICCMVIAVLICVVITVVVCTMGMCVCMPELETAFLHTFYYLFLFSPVAYKLHHIDFYHIIILSFPYRIKNPRIRLASDIHKHVC